MSANPYQPTAAVALPVSMGRAWKMIAKIAAAIYGCVYVALCAFTAVLDVQVGRSIAWIGINATLDALTVYGIFAMALPMIRIGRLFPVWRVFAWILPVYLTTAAFWDIWTDPQPFTPVEYAFGMLFFILLAAPAIALNFMLRKRLLALTPAHHASGT